MNQGKVRPLTVGLLAFSLFQFIPVSAFASDYVAHEWGTFTSVQDSDGNTLEGLDHADTELPDFVYGRSQLLQSSRSPSHLDLLSILPSGLPSGLPGSLSSGISTNISAGWATGLSSGVSGEHWGHCGKCLDFDPKAGSLLSVTQKMETPVIYFYSTSPQHVSVEVEFPDGIISQYFPNASTFSPPIGAVSALKNGKMDWEIEISTNRLAIPEVSKNSTWQSSREVNSNFISTQGENEKLLFYRGVGNFKTSLRIVSTSESQLQIQNPSEETIPNAFLLNISEKSGEIIPLGPIPSRGQRELPTSVLSINQSQATLPKEEFIKTATQNVALALVESGLFSDEAQAMVNTWKTSYFNTPGTRILYILPRSWTDEILPLHMRPQPTQLVRTLVGRVEILGHAEEQDLITRLNVDLLTGDSGQIELTQLGRFAEPKLRRVLQLISTPAFSDELRSYVQKLVDLASELDN